MRNDNDLRSQTCIESQEGIEYKEGVKRMVIANIRYESRNEYSFYLKDCLDCFNQIIPMILLVIKKYHFFKNMNEIRF